MSEAPAPLSIFRQRSSPLLPHRLWTAIVATFVVAAVFLLPGPVQAEPASDEQDRSEDIAPYQIADVRGAIGGIGGGLAGQGDGLEDGSTFGGIGAVYFTERVGAEVTVQRHSLDLVSTSENALSGGSLDSTIVTGNILGRFPVSSRVAPYVTGGVAFFSTEFEINPSVVSELETFNFSVTEELDSTVGFNVGGGVDFLVTQRFGVFGDLRFLSGSSDTTAQITDQIGGIAASDSGSQDLDGVTFVGGVKIFF